MSSSASRDVYVKEYPVLYPEILAAIEQHYQPLSYEFHVLNTKTRTTRHSSSSSVEASVLPLLLDEQRQFVRYKIATRYYTVQHLASDTIRLTIYPDLKSMHSTIHTNSQHTQQSSTVELHILYKVECPVRLVYVYEATVPDAQLVAKFQHITQSVTSELCARNSRALPALAPAKRVFVQFTQPLQQRLERKSFALESALEHFAKGHSPLHC